MDDRKDIREKNPIYPLDIERCRENLQIGQQVRIRVREQDPYFRFRMVQKICTVEEKYRWLFLVRDQRGKRYTVRYVDMMTQDEKLI